MGLMCHQKRTSSLTGWYLISYLKDDTIQRNSFASLYLHWSFGICGQFKGLKTSVGLLLSFFDMIRESIMRMSHFLLQVGYVLRWDLCPYHSRQCTTQAPSYLRIIALVSIWFRMLLTQKVSWVYKDTLTLIYPPNINI